MSYIIKNKSKHALVLFLLDYVERNFNYLILRNYEGLPEDEGHDIDFLISTLELNKIEHLLKELTTLFDVVIFKNYRYNNLRSHIIVFESEILHLDFFTEIQWNRISLFNTNQLLERKVRFKHSYWIIDKNSLNKYCWFLYVIRQGALKKDKYVMAAWDWESKSDRMYSYISLNGNNKKFNKILLLLTYLKANPIGVVKGSLSNVFFKFTKIVNPYGKIFMSDSDITTKEICINYCFIGRLEFTKNEFAPFSIFSIYRAISDERGVVLSDGFYKKNRYLKFILNRYFVKTEKDLKKSVKLTLK